MTFMLAAKFCFFFCSFIHSFCIKNQRLQFCFSHAFCHYANHTDSYTRLFWPQFTVRLLVFFSERKSNSHWQNNQKQQQTKTSISYVLNASFSISHQYNRSFFFHPFGPSKNIHSHKWRKRNDWSEIDNKIQQINYYETALFSFSHSKFVFLFILVCGTEWPSQYIHSLSLSLAHCGSSQNSVTKISVRLLHALTNQREWEMKAERH